MIRNGIDTFSDIYNFDQQIHHTITKSQIFEISHFLSQSPKYMSYKDLHTNHFEAFKDYIGVFEYNMALGVRVLGLQEKISISFFFVYFHEDL